MGNSTSSGGGSEDRWTQDAVNDARRTSYQPTSRPAETPPTHVSLETGSVPVASAGNTSLSVSGPSLKVGASKDDGIDAQASLFSAELAHKNEHHDAFVGYGVGVGGGIGPYGEGDKSGFRVDIPGGPSFGYASTTAAESVETLVNNGQLFPQ